MILHCSLSFPSFLFILLVIKWLEKFVNIYFLEHFLDRSWAFIHKMLKQHSFYVLQNMFITFLLPFPIICLSIGICLIVAFVSALLNFLDFREILREKIVGFVMIWQFANFPFTLKNGVYFSQVVLFFCQ